MRSNSSRPRAAFSLSPSVSSGAGSPKPPSAPSTPYASTTRGKPAKTWAWSTVSRHARSGSPLGAALRRRATSSQSPTTTATNRRERRRSRSLNDMLALLMSDHVAHADALAEREAFDRPRAAARRDQHDRRTHLETREVVAARERTRRFDCAVAAGLDADHADAADVERADHHQEQRPARGFEAQHGALVDRQLLGPRGEHLRRDRVARAGRPADFRQARVDRRVHAVV